MQWLRKSALVLAAVTTLLVVGWFVLDYRTHARLLAGPMLQDITPEGFTLVWQMHPQQPAGVTIRTLDGTHIKDFPATLQNNRYVARITGLGPGTTYEYHVKTTTGLERLPPLAVQHARTTPPLDGSFRFIAFGDSGDGRLYQRRLAGPMDRYRPDLIIHTGDLIYDNGEAKDYLAKFYRPYHKMLAFAAFYPCPGNHDVRTDTGQPLFDNFILPQNGPPTESPERHYWFDYGHARFIAIDSNVGQSVLQREVAPWLDEVLAAAGDRWRIVFFHEPPYTNGRYEPAAKILTTIVPILDRHKVELVLCGHDHGYQRTYPIRAGKATPNGEGTVYVITAAGGARLYSFRLPPPDDIAAWNDNQHSFSVIDVTPDTIMLRQIGITGEILDTAHIMRPIPPTPPIAQRNHYPAPSSIVRMFDQE